MSERDNTLRPLSHASSTGNLREEAKNGQVQHPRSATVSAGTFDRQQDQSRTTSLGRTPSNKSSKSSRSGLRLRLKSEASPPTPALPDRSAASNSPPNSSSSVITPAEDGSIVMRPIVESPTGITHNTLQDFNPAKPALGASQTLPNIPSSALLSAHDNSDAVSVVSVNSTSKSKRKMFRRGSVREATSPLTPTLASPGTFSKRKNTGLASALAASGLAMANSAVAMPQIPVPADMMARPDRSNSVTSSGARSGRARASLDNTRSPARSRQTSLSYPTSDYSDRESFVSGVEGASDEDDDLDLDADDIPVTGFAVASARRNVEFHEMFPNIPEGDYLIEGACRHASDIMPFLRD